MPEKYFTCMRCKHTEPLIGATPIFCPRCGVKFKGELVEPLEEVEEEIEEVEVACHHESLPLSIVKDVTTLSNQFFGEICSIRSHEFDRKGAIELSLSLLEDMYNYLQEQ
jgi:hypothetical protein